MVRNLRVSGYRKIVSQGWILPHHFKRYGEEDCENLSQSKGRRRDVDVKLDGEDALAAPRHRQRSREEPRVMEEEAGNRCYSLVSRRRRSA